MLQEPGDAPLRVVAGSADKVEEHPLQPLPAFGVEGPFLAVDLPGIDGAAVASRLDVEAPFGTAIVLQKPYLGAAREAGDPGPVVGEYELALGVDLDSMAVPRRFEGGLVAIRAHVNGVVAGPARRRRRRRRGWRWRCRGRGRRGCQSHGDRKARPQRPGGEQEGEGKERGSVHDWAPTHTAMLPADPPAPRAAPATSRRAARRGPGAP